MGIGHFCLLLTLYRNLVKDSITEMAVLLSSLILQLGQFFLFIISALPTEFYYQKHKNTPTLHLSQTEV